MTKFEIGKTYYTRSACDQNCVWIFAVVKRTEKTVTIKEPGKKPLTKRIYIYDNTEMVKPLGSYSMNPILSAEKVA